MKAFKVKMMIAYGQEIFTKLSSTQFPSQILIAYVTLLFPLTFEWPAYFQLPMQSDYADVAVMTFPGLSDYTPLLEEFQETQSA